MAKVLILGAGKIGALISGLLAESGSYEVHLGDVSAEAANAVVSAHRFNNLHAHHVDAANGDAPPAQLKKHPVDAIISSCPTTAMSVSPKQPTMRHPLLRSHRRRRSHARRSQDRRRLIAGVRASMRARAGFISIAANELIGHFDELRAVKLRVGALPQHPNNVLKYSLTWSTEGLINEYGNPCEAIVDARRIEAAPLEGLEEIEIDGTLYEAFNTSGGLGSLAETYGARVQSMDYKTMRYPGHCEQMRLLMNDLKLNHDRGTLKRILENAVPQTLQDVVVIYVAVTGKQDGELREENYVNKVYPQVIAGRLWSAIQVTTASGICAVVDLVVNGGGKHHGFVRQEDFRLQDVLTNRFGKHYAAVGGKEVSGHIVVSGQTGHQRRH